MRVSIAAHRRTVISHIGLTQTIMESPPPSPPQTPADDQNTTVAAVEDQPTSVAGSAPAQGPPIEPAADDPKPLEDHFYARVFGVATAAILAIALYQILSPFMGPLMWALFIAFLLYPLHIRLTRRLKGRESLSAALLTSATLLVLIGPLTAMSAAFVAQVSTLVQWIQNSLASHSWTWSNVPTDWPIIGPALTWVADNFGISADQVRVWITQATEHIPQLLAGLGGQLFLGALNTVLAFVVMLFLLFFFVRDGANLVNMVRELVPISPKRRDQLVDHVASVTRAVVFGTGLTALIQGAIVGIAFVITGLSTPLVFGVIAALLALLPFGGTALVWIPAVGVLIAQGHWGMAIVMLIIGLFSSSIDNVIRPLLISGRAEVGTLTVFIGVLGGTAAFGPIGLFLGPVVLALIIALTRFAVEMRHVP